MCVYCNGVGEIEGLEANWWGEVAQMGGKGMMWVGMDVARAGADGAEKWRYFRGTGSRKGGG